MSDRTLNSSSLAPALLAKTYTSFASELDLVADSTTLLGGKTGEPCRRIRVVTAGDVACYFAGAPTTKVVISFAAGDVDDLQLVKIGTAADGTTSTKITVYW